MLYRALVLILIRIGQTCQFYVQILAELLVNVGSLVNAAYSIDVVVDHNGGTYKESCLDRLICMESTCNMHVI